ncbi:hypothetical protein [Treponema berlinense]|uniref:hypothetical protein n=1 Tax=Treponema berlinense TaxID=225004 RepID=UPI0026EDA1D1|nr:hypothetical protein [Treponema berlinense]
MPKHATASATEREDFRYSSTSFLSNSFLPGLVIPKKTKSEAFEKERFALAFSLFESISTDFINLK